MDITGSELPRIPVKRRTRGSGYQANPFRSRLEDGARANLEETMIAYPFTDREELQACATILAPPTESVMFVNFT